MTSDADEALAILARARHAKDPDAYEKDRLEAAKALLRALVTQAVKAGHDAKMLEDERIADVVPTPGARGKVWVRASAHGFRIGADSYGSATGQTLEPAIEFDAALGTWVGVELDTSRVPIPGEAKDRRRSALAVVANALVDALGRIS